PLSSLYPYTTLFRSLKGDVYIWSGNLLGGGAADFNEAKSALSQIASMGVSLEPDFASLWSTENEENKEFIFAVDYQQDQATNYRSEEHTSELQSREN